MGEEGGACTRVGTYVRAYIHLYLDRWEEVICEMLLFEIGHFLEKLK